MVGDADQHIHHALALGKAPAAVVEGCVEVLVGRSVQHAVLGDARIQALPQEGLIRPAVVEGAVASGGAVGCCLCLNLLSLCQGGVPVHLTTGKEGSNSRHSRLRDKPRLHNCHNFTRALLALQAWW